MALVPMALEVARSYPTQGARAYGSAWGRPALDPVGRGAIRLLHAKRRRRASSLRPGCFAASWAVTMGALGIVPGSGVHVYCWFYPRRPEYEGRRRPSFLERMEPGVVAAARNLRALPEA